MTTTASEVYADVVLLYKLNIFQSWTFLIKIYNILKNNILTCSCCFRRKLTALALRKSIESAIQWFQIHHRITFETIQNPAVQWATLVTHHFFRAHIFWQKCWNQTFSTIIDFLTFYLFDDIGKKYWNHSCKSFCYVKGNFDKNAKMHVLAGRLYFLILF